MARKGIYCDTNCWWKWTANGLCPEKKECVCTACSGLDAIDIGIYEACRLACNADDKGKRPTSPSQFICTTIGPADAFLRYGYTCAGFNPLTDTAEGKLLTEKNAKVQENSKTMRYAALGTLAVLGLIALLSFLPKEN